jgi:hypothetical protein
VRVSASYILASVLLSCGPLTAAETQVIPEETVVPTLTVEQPTNPVSSKPGGPILVSISARLGPSFRNVPTQTIIPEFHFVAPNGNAVLLHRALIETSANGFSQSPSAAINTPPDAQKKGAVIVGGFNCNRGQYYVTQSAYIMDADGNRSNSVRYTIHCNGG